MRTGRMLGFLAVLAMTVCLMHCSGQSVSKDSQKGNLLFMLEADESLQPRAKKPEEMSGGHSPEGTKWLMVIRDESLYDYEWVLVDTKPVITGECVAKAEAQCESGMWELELTFTPEGKEIFARITSGNVGKRLAIVYNGICISAPEIHTEITDGQAVITGAGVTEQEVRDMAEALNPGR